PPSPQNSIPRWCDKAWFQKYCHPELSEGSAFPGSIAIGVPGFFGAVPRKLHALPRRESTKCTVTRQEIRNARANIACNEMGSPRDDILSSRATTLWSR